MKKKNKQILTSLYKNATLKGFLEILIYRPVIFTKNKFFSNFKCPFKIGHLKCPILCPQFTVSIFTETVNCGESATSLQGCEWLCKMKDLPPEDEKQSCYKHTTLCYHKCIRTGLCSDPIRNDIRVGCPCQDLSVCSNSVKHTPTCGGTDHSHFDNVIKCRFVGTFAITNHHRGRSLVSTVNMMDYCCKTVYFKPKLNPFSTLVN